VGSLDTQKILRYTGEIREAQGLRVEMTSEDIDQCSADPIKMRAMKYTLIVLVEAICNLCRHILAKKTHVVVEEYMEAILKMEEKGFLSGQTANSLIPLTKLRHQLIHGYWKTDDRRLFAETKNSLKIIDGFLSEINRLIS
jgi:uncharacterized protein YutE (UPF0331/DUF86 family)